MKRDQHDPAGGRRPTGDPDPPRPPARHAALVPVDRVGMTPPASEELERELVDWLASLTGTDDLTITRRTGGASRRVHRRRPARRRNHASSGSAPTPASSRRRATACDVRPPSTARWPRRPCGSPSWSPCTRPSRRSSCNVTGESRRADLGRRRSSRSPSSSWTSSPRCTGSSRQRSTCRARSARDAVGPRARRDRRVGPAVRVSRRRCAGRVTCDRVAPHEPAGRGRLAGRAGAGRYRPGQLHVPRRPTRRSHRLGARALG